jgi:hypothetical protein
MIVLINLVGETRDAESITMRYIIQTHDINNPSKIIETNLLTKTACALRNPFHLQNHHSFVALPLPPFHR